MVVLLRNGKAPALSAWKPLAAGWVAAAVVSWLASPSITAHLLSWSELLRVALRCTLFAFLAAALAARLSRSPSWGFLWLVAAAAAWFAPLAVLLSAHSLWAVVATAVLAACAVTLVHLPPHSEDPPRRALLAMCASLASQTGAIAVFLNRACEAAALAAVSAALLAWLLAGNWQSAPGRPRRSVLLLTASAALFTAGGLVRYLPNGSGVGGLDNGTAAAGELENPSGGHGTPNVAVGDVYPGVILWPEVQQYARLVPPLPALGHGFSLSRTHPLSIPFFGAYWFYKAPDRRLPPNPFRTRGDPAAITFRSTDHRPMHMEAHQNLGTLIDLSCCSRIEVAIRNGDHYPGSVSLEVVLANTTLSGRPSESLGTATAMSIPHWSPADGDRIISETLKFPIPPASNLQRFDEITVIFKLTAVRADRSARIALDRFLLVPNGL